MADNFNLRQFLTENKLTSNSRMLNENVEVDEEWPKEMFSRHKDMKFILQKISSDRATYQIIDLENNNNKPLNTITFNSVRNLEDFADNHIKPQGGTRSTYLGENKQK